MGRRVLVVEDDADTRGLVRIWLRDAGYEVFEEASAEGAIERLRGGEPDLMVVDVRLPGMSGYQLARESKRAPGAPPVLLFTVTDREDVPADAPIDGFLTKPCTRRGLVAAVEATVAA